MPEELPLSDLNVAEYLQDSGGGFIDVFVELKKRNDFLDVSNKYKLDDPAEWPALKRKFVLNLLKLEGSFEEAKSMMNTPDSRSGLDDKLVSSENIRNKGSELYEKLSFKVNELRQSLRLIGELEDLFELVSQEHAVTGDIDLQSVAGQSLTGQVLFIDGSDLIVKRQDAGYFRIPASMLSESTKMNILDLIVSSWEPLEGLVEEDVIAEQNAGGLIAYSDSHLYIEDKSEDVVLENRENSHFVFQTYEKQIEEWKAEHSKKKWYGRKNGPNEELQQLQKLEAGRDLNLERIETITLYESRLEAKLPEGERKQLNADGDKLISDSEVEAAVATEASEDVEAVKPDLKSALGE